MNEALALEEWDITRTRTFLALNEKGGNRFPLRVEQMWLAELRQNGRGPEIPFDIKKVILLDAKTSIDDIRECVFTITQRHEALRTQVEIVNSRMQQVVLQAGASLDVIHLNGSALDDPDSLDEAIRVNSLSPLKILYEPSFHCRLYVDEAKRKALELRVHHYFCDGYSMRLLENEIRAFFHRHPESIPPATNPRFQYIDYAREQRVRLNQSLENTVSYWKGLLSGPHSSSLPYDMNGHSNMMESLFFTVHCDIANNIRYASKDNNLSVFAFCLVGFQLSLSAWSAQKSVVTAISVADRFDPAFHETFGYLITALPIIGNLTEDVILKDAVKSAADQILRAYLKRDFSYELYDELFSPPAPFCTTLFNYLPLSYSVSDQLAISDIQFTSNPPRNLSVERGVQFFRQMHHRDLYLQLIEKADGSFQGKVFYNIDRFSYETVHKFLEGYVSVLATIPLTLHKCIGQVVSEL